MITTVSNTEKFPNNWIDDIIPSGTPIPNDLKEMPTWREGKYYKHCGMINKNGLDETLTPEKLIRLDFKVPPSIPSQDYNFNLLLIELNKFMKRKVKKVLHIDFELDNQREPGLIKQLKKYNTNTSHLEIQYPETNTIPSLDYKNLDKNWSSITIRYGHGQR